MNQQSWQGSPVPCVLNVAPSRNRLEVVAVVAEVLGSESVGDLPTQSLIIVGTTERKPAKHGRISSQQLVST